MIIRRVVVGTVIVLMLSTIAFFIVMWYLPLDQTPTDQQLKLKQQFIDVYKVIAIGVLLAVLGLTIPYLLPEGRDRLERFKKSRDAYSLAKTSVMYLPGKIVSLKSFDQALASIREAHQNLHLAETYREELRRHLHWHPHPETWLDRNYWEIVAVRKALYSNVDKWSHLSPDDRLKLVQQELKVVNLVFDVDNRKWANELRLQRWAELLRPKKSKRDRKINLEKKIREALRIEDA